MPRYIDADALKAKYEQMLPEIGDGYHKETLQDVLFELEYAPTVSPDEVRSVGKWILVDGIDEQAMARVHYIYCSNCGRQGLETRRGNGCRSTYCPHCGAKMEVSE